MIFPFQSGSTLATAGCDSKRTARKMTSALAASANVTGTTPGPTAAASAAKSRGSRVVATETSMPLRANAAASAWPIWPKPMMAYVMSLLLHGSGNRDAATDVAVHRHPRRPATGHRLVQRDRTDHGSGARGGESILCLQAGAFGVEHFEQVGRAGLEAHVRQLRGT